MTRDKIITGSASDVSRQLSPVTCHVRVGAAALLTLAFCVHVPANETTNLPAPVTARDYYNAGTELLAAKKYAGAEQMFQSALAAQDERVQPAALYNLGHARFDDGAELLKKGPDAQRVASRGNTVSAAGTQAIRAAQSALDENDMSKMIAAYLEGRGVRHELRDAEKAVQSAMEADGNTLRLWRRAVEDFKSAAEMNPADTNAVRNAHIIEQHIAKLVDSLQKMQQMAAAMAGQHQQMNGLLSQLTGRIPKENMPPDAGGGNDDEDVQPGSLAGQKENPSREGDQMQMPLSPDQAGQLLDGLSLDGNRRLLMSDQQGKPSQDKKGRDW